MVSSISKLQGVKKGERTNRLKETSEAWQPVALYGPYFDPNSDKCTIKKFKQGNVDIN